MCTRHLMVFTKLMPREINVLVYVYDVFLLSNLTSSFLNVLLLCCVGLHCSIYKSSYNVSNISYLNLPPPPFSFIHPYPIPGIVSTDIILYLHTRVHSICTIFTLSSLLSSTLLRLVPTPSLLQAGAVLLSCSPMLQKKTMTFLFV
jgi:hypothetical protein